MLTDDGRAGVLRIGGDIAADELSPRIDTAQLLTTVGLAVGVERAVHTATAELGEDAVARALPLLQPIAMTPTTRAALKGTRPCSARCGARSNATDPSRSPSSPSSFGA